MERSDGDSGDAMKSDTTDLIGTIDERLDGKLVWAIVCALLIVHVILAWQAREIGLVSAQDDGRYMLLARSLRDFSYRDIYLVGLPFHSVYPPGFPVALAVWGVIFGESFHGFVLMNVGMSALALTIAFLAIRRGWSTTGALLCLAVMSINPHMVQRPGGVRSETLYIALSFVTLWALAPRKPNTRMLWVAAAAAVAAALTRSVGLSLVAAIGILWLMQRRYRPLAVFGVAAGVTVGAWMVWSAVAPDQVVGYNYFADVLDQSGALGLVAALGQRVADMLPNYAGLTLPWVLGVPTIPGTPVDNAVISAVTLLAMLAGMVTLFRRWPIAIIYMLLYGVLLVVWPYHRPRFMEPLIPVMLATSLLGISVIVGRFRAHWALPAMALATALLVFGGIRRTTDLVEFRASCGPLSLAEPPACMQADRASLLRTLDYIDRNTPDDAVFVTAKPEALFFYTNRQSVLLQATFVGEWESYVGDLRRKGVDYVILGSLHADELVRLAPRLEPLCSELEVEAFFPPRTYLLRLGNSESPGESDACQALEDHRKANVNRRFTEDRA